MPFVAIPLAFLLLGVQVSGDAKSGLTRPKIETSKLSGYVTQAEAKKVFTQAESLIRKVTKTTAKPSVSAIANSTKAVSRAQIVTEFGRLYKVAQPMFRVTPAPVQVNSKVVNMSNASARPTLDLLIKRGAIANYGPLATAPVDRLTLEQFGDALGFFLARIAEMTHMPSSKFSPPLMSG